ncbi:MAG: hypothetical protein HYV07_13665 [Deltaproteobacteria bacterium]|nr:hypothetical protein [Deltaproteobacteria bacterium]
MSSSWVIRKLVRAVLDAHGLDTSDRARVADVEGFVSRQIRRAPDAVRPLSEVLLMALALTPSLDLERARAGAATQDATRLLESLVLYRWFDDAGD